MRRPGIRKRQKAKSLKKLKEHFAKNKKVEAPVELKIRRNVMTLRRMVKRTLVRQK